MKITNIIDIFYKIAFDKLANSRIESLKSKYPKDWQKSLIGEFERSDPSKSKKYIEWAIKQYMTYADPNKTKIDQGHYYEIIDDNIRKEIIQAIYFFHKHFRTKDINKYSLKGVINLEQKLLDKKSEIDKIYEDDKFVVVLIKNHFASIKYGKGTRWCISGSHLEHSDIYNKYIKAFNIFYFIINKYVNMLENKYDDVLYKIAVRFNGKDTETGEYDIIFYAADDKIITSNRVKTYLEEHYNQIFEKIHSSMDEEDKKLRKLFAEKCEQIKDENEEWRLIEESTGGKLPEGQKINEIVIDRIVDNIKNGKLEYYSWIDIDNPKMRNALLQAINEKKVDINRLNPYRLLWSEKYKTIFAYPELSDLFVNELLNGNDNFSHMLTSNDKYTDKVIEIISKLVLKFPEIAVGIFFRNFYNSKNMKYVSFFLDLCKNNKFMSLLFDKIKRDTWYFKLFNKQIKDAIKQHYPELEKDDI